jgi:hypothetical protein
MTIDWIPITDVQPGDRVKIPRGSSWGFYDSREDAERGQITFRCVERVEHDAFDADGNRLGSGWVTLWLTDGTVHRVPAWAHVLRRPSEVGCATHELAWRQRRGH